MDAPDRRISFRDFFQGFCGPHSESDRELRPLFSLSAQKQRAGMGMAKVITEEVRYLLANVSKLSSAIGECRREGQMFNVFRLCVVDHYENAHSRIIAEFLNPQGMHGQGDKFLRLFLSLPNVAQYLRRKGYPLDDEMQGLDTAMVLTEESFLEGRCDMTIHWRGWCIVIENKIYAADQGKQLERYEQAILRTGEKPVLLHLSLVDRADREDVNKVDYCHLSYREDLAMWLEECVCGSKEILGVHETLNQYHHLIKELSGTSEEQKMNTEIVKEMVATPASFKAACKVTASVQEARAEIARMIMDSLREEMRSRDAFDGWLLQDQLASLLMGNGRCTGFWLEREVADKPYDIYCEFQARGAVHNVYSGLTRREEKRNEAIKFLRAAEKSEKLQQKYTVFAEDQSGGWLYGCYPHDKEMRTWSDDLLARLIDPEHRRQFAVKLANYLQTFLEEAAEVEDLIGLEQQDL